jgi:hypothetical protein
MPLRLSISRTVIHWMGLLWSPSDEARDWLFSSTQPVTHLRLPLQRLRSRP